MTDFEDPLPNRRYGIPIAGGAARSGWKPEPKRPRRTLAITSKTNPAARAAAKAERKGARRMTIE